MFYYSFIIFFKIFLAAHCFRDKDQAEAVRSEHVVAMLGKHNLTNYNERGSKNFSVLAIVLHPEWEWDSSINSSFHADIAVVSLKTPTLFSRFIKPVCLPQQSFDYPTGDGFISGWGMSNYYERHAILPNELNIPIIGSLYCLTRFKKLVEIASISSFCGGFENQNKGACLGDSGGGFYSHDSPTKPWIVRGIVSGAVLNNDRKCDVNAFQIYTNVGQFADWIEKILKGKKKISF
jgi:hypothetical protein